MKRSPSIIARQPKRTPPPPDSLDQIRARLCEIEWIWCSFYGDADCIRCPACEREFEQRNTDNAEHKPDCWLKAEIDKRQVRS